MVGRRACKHYLVSACALARAFAALALALASTAAYGKSLRRRVLCRAALGKKGGGLSLFARRHELLSSSCRLARALMLMLAQRVGVRPCA